MSRIDKLELNIRDMSSSIRRTLRKRGAAQNEEIIRKSFGEKPPKRADISKDPFLMSLFGANGLVDRLKKKIERAAKHQATIIPAEEISAMAMPEIPGKQEGNLIFLGVDFVKENHDNPDAIAGVLSHEWGHLISDFPHQLDADDMHWDEIHDMRRWEESYADAYAGRLLYLIGHKPEGLIRHLEKKTGNSKSPKYYELTTRKAIILAAYEAQATQQDRAVKIFGKDGQHTPFAAKLIAVA